MSNTEAMKSKPLSRQEIKVLLDLVEGSRYINNKTTTATSNKLKNQEWIRITHRFNSTAAMVPRTPAQLRLKWENLKKNARKRNMSIRMNKLTTVGGDKDYIPTPPDDILDRVTSILGTKVSSGSVPFGGDKDLVDRDSDDDGGGSVIGEASNCSDDGIIVGNASIFLENVEIEEKPTEDSHCNSSSVPSDEVLVDKEKTVHNDLYNADKPKRIKYGKRTKMLDDWSTRNIAINDFYTVKKQCLQSKMNGILLSNKKLELENKKLELEIELLQIELLERKKKIQ